MVIILMFMVNRTTEVLCLRTMFDESDLDKRILTYFKTVLPELPKHFIVCEYYKELREYENLQNLFDSEGAVALQISRPKGVGKSTSLFAFALQLTISNITREDTTILYLTEKSSDRQFTNGYLQCNNLCFTFS